MSKWHGGKGSRRRSYDSETFNAEYDRIFQKKSRTKKCVACGKEYRLDFYRTTQVKYKVMHKDVCKNCEDW